MDDSAETNINDIMNGPFTVDVNVYLTDGDNVGVAKCNMAVGRAPTPADCQRIVATSLAQTIKSAGSDFRLMTRHEFENAIIQERSNTSAGMMFATKAEFDPLPEG